MKAQRPSGILFAFLAIGLGVVAALLLAELSVRLLLPPSRWQFQDGSENFQPDREIGWSQKPGLRSTIVQEAFGWTTHFETNPDGLLPASAARGKLPGIRRIMIFGDSTAVGRLVPEDDRIHSKLQGLLRQRGAQVEVINAGVEGYSTDQELVLMRRLVPQYQPDIVLLVVCENDLAGNVTATVFDMPKPRFIVVHGKITRLISPDPALLGIRPPRPSLIRRVVARSALYRAFLPQIVGLRSRYFDLSDRNPILDLPEDFFFRPNAADSLQFETMEALVAEMKRVCDRYGAWFMIYDHPSLNETWNPYISAIEARLHLKANTYDRYALERRMKQICDRNAINFCPLIDYFVQNQSRGPFHLLPRDPHCNPAGYQLTAERLAECLGRSAPAFH